MYNTNIFTIHVSVHTCVYIHIVRECAGEHVVLRESFARRCTQILIHIHIEYVYSHYTYKYIHMYIYRTCVCWGAHGPDLNTILKYITHIHTVQI